MELCFTSRPCRFLLLLRICWMLTSIPQLAKAQIKPSVTPQILSNSGEMIRFNCSTIPGSSVDWQIQKKGSHRQVNIFTGNAKGGGGQKSNEYKNRERYQVDFDISLGRYDLLINNATKEDEGLYNCNDISDPESSKSWTLTIEGEIEMPDSHNKVDAAEDSTANLTFPTSKRDHIQLEHRSVGRNYPLHVFRDGRLVNDYYVLSRRYKFSASEQNSWALVIQKVNSSDAGSLICTEDNGLGKQYSTELVVIKKNGVSCSVNNETCQNEYNVTCAVKYTGNIPPIIRINSNGDHPTNIETSVVDSSTVYLIATAKRSSKTSCYVLTQSRLISAICTPPDCSRTAVEDASLSNAGSITAAVITTLISVALVAFISVLVIFYRRKRRQNLPNRHEMSVVHFDENKEHELLKSTELSN